MDILKTQIDNFSIKTFSNDWMGLSINRDKIWEPHITNFLKRNLTPSSILVDAGSNYGWHSIVSSFLCTSVYSFEPQIYIYNIQMENILENNILNIQCYNYALGDINGIREMTPIDYAGSSINMGDLGLGLGGEKIEVKTLDSFGINKIDFVKMDVQGYEKYVLQGASQTILLNKPTLIIEIEEHQLRKFDYGADELFGILKDFGYIVYLLDYRYPSDHICVHKDRLQQFIEINKKYIQPLHNSNNLNRNIENGVTEKICQ